MSYIESLESENLMMLASDIRSEYNKIRQQYHEISIRYYRQSIASSYYKESDMIEMLSKCEALKNRYLEIRDILLGRGLVPAFENHWRDSNNMLFNGDVLHIA